MSPQITAVIPQTGSKCQCNPCWCDICGNRLHRWLTDAHRGAKAATMLMAVLIIKDKLLSFKYQIKDMITVSVLVLHKVSHGKSIYHWDRKPVETDITGHNCKIAGASDPPSRDKPQCDVC